MLGTDGKAKIRTEVEARAKAADDDRGAEGPVRPLKTMDEFHAAIGSGRVSVINFWADWSATSRMISPMFEEHAGEYTDIRFYAVDVDAYPEIGESIGIRAMPTFVAFRDGKSIADVIGANPGALLNLIKSCS